MNGRTTRASIHVLVYKQASRQTDKLIVTLHVGTHGSCVRSNGLFIVRLLPACQPVYYVHLSTYFAWADARAVRPYNLLATILQSDFSHIAR